MGHFRKVQDVVCALPLSNKGHPGGLRPRIDPQFDWLCIPFRPVFEPDGERISFVNDGTAVLEKLPRPGGTRRHERLAILRKHENAAYAARGVYTPVAPSFDGLLSHMLTTRVWTHPVSFLTRIVY